VGIHIFKCKASQDRSNKKVWDHLDLYLFYYRFHKIMNTQVLLSIPCLLACTVHLPSLLFLIFLSGFDSKLMAQGRAVGFRSEWRGIEGVTDMDAVIGCHGAPARFSCFRMVLMLSSPSLWCSCSVLVLPHGVCAQVAAEERRWGGKNGAHQGKFGAMAHARTRSSKSSTSISGLYNEPM